MLSDEHSASIPTVESMLCNSYSQWLQSYRNILKGVLGNDEACCGNKDPKLKKDNYGNQQAQGGLRTTPNCSSKIHWGNDEAWCGNKDPKLKNGKHGNQQTQGGLPTNSNWSSNIQRGKDVAWSSRIPDFILISLQLLCNQIQTLQADVRQLKTEVCDSNKKGACRRLVTSGPYHIEIEGQSLNWNARGLSRKEDCWAQAEKSGKTRQYVTQEVKNLVARYKWAKEEEIASKKRSRSSRASAKESRINRNRGKTKDCVSQELKSLAVRYKWANDEKVSSIRTSRPSSSCFEESGTKKSRAVTQKLRLRSQWLRANWVKRGNWHSQPNFTTSGSSKSWCLKYKKTHGTPHYEKLLSPTMLKPEPDKDRISRQRTHEDPQQTVPKISQPETSKRMAQVDFVDEDSSEEMLSSDLDHNRFSPREVGGYSADDEFW